ncbi:ROK family transcriptional regulator [Bifidobacterium sp. ESL0728]|uniref:ROK family transcriptional regulator n=1 Tax=Bifidobacterium sp. ESL0728 TaxID=2983220 RepID=UPI0023F9B7F9|nr:ROK family transcriptional regulator [Bifidobacterium sp. ESL0728]WEV59422.1 ROK family transcriptional regulator [Bifidobacterium sp. ESL0728]
MPKATTASIKAQNLHAVTAHIYTHHGVTKQDLQQTLGLSLPTISQNLRALEQSGLIAKGQTLDSTGGRRARTYVFQPQTRCAIGVGTASNQVTLCAVDLKGNVIAEEHHDITFSANPKSIANIGQKISRFAASLEGKGSHVLGAAFAIKGLISEDGSEVIYGNIMNDTGLELTALEKATGLKCALIHDSMASASAELWFDKSIHDAICLYLGRRPGGAIIVDGSISLGPNRRNGTIEHMTLVPGGLPCYCGNKGCMDPYCSTEFLTGDDKDTGKQSLDTFFASVRAGDEKTGARFDSWLGYLAQTINNVRNVLACDIIIGGAVTQYLTAEDFARLKTKCDSLNTFQSDTYQIRKSICGQEQEIVGAALHYIDPYVSSICE